jgi:hypothetical protein
MIEESKVLLRTRTDLPKGFKVAAGEYVDGWTVMRTGGARRLERKTQACGWHFVSIGGSSVRSGVGGTSQLAIANALRLALKQVDADANAVELECIEFTHYPWFALAKVRTKSYRIQQDAAGPALSPSPIPSVVLHKRLSSEASEVFPGFNTAAPMLKEMLVQSRSAAVRAQ